MYELKTEAKIHKTLDKGHFIEETDTFSEAQAIKKRLCVMNPENTLMIVGKSERARMILRRYVDTDTKNQQEPKLEYKTCGRAGYSRELVSWIMELFKMTSDDTESVKIWTAKDYPMTAEDEDFKIILAPRVEE